MKKPKRYYIQPKVITNMIESHRDVDMSAVEAMQIIGYGPHDINVYRWLEYEVGAFSANTLHPPEQGVSIHPDTENMLIATHKGVIEAKPGDWVIRNSKGTFFKCESEDFKATYMLA